MATLLIASHAPGAGKTAIAAGLARLFERSGASVSVCKPLSPAGSADPDAGYFADGFGGSAAVAEGDDAAALDNAADAVRSLSGNSDHTLVEVANPVSGSGLASPLTAGLVERLSARVIAVFRYDAQLSAVAVSGAVAPLGDALAGVIVNQTPRYRVAEVGAMLTEAATVGITAMAALPEDRAMLSLTMKQLAQQLGGQWELEPSDGEDWIDRFLIGGNIMDSGTGYFGRYPHQAVITRAERPDIQMASLMQDTRCLVLTGGGRPTEYIRVEAAKRDVPVLLVDGGTVATADAVGNLLGAVVPYHAHKAERMADLLAERIDLAAVL
ncbi:MAG: phosphotransacetylase family protein [Chloroflexi bacterium]|nr:phosphotransacetylase family protein [Chloroflexota bacterium]MYD47934.1 phosphotransacetylase family protein [Chloroflexota bacterium]